LTETALEAPFPYFGGKSTVADAIWERLGDTPNYVEPFFGSGAVLLRRPHEPRIETVNDADGLVANFWRAVRQDPEQTAYHADWPVNENDLHARHSWLVAQKEPLQARLEGDVEFYDPKVAGWWAWGMSCWIGSGFCSGDGPWVIEGKELVNRQRPHLKGGQGVNRQRPSLRSAGGGMGVHRPTAELYDWFEALSARLRHVRVCCGDWTRVLGPSPTTELGVTGVFLDPPYLQHDRSHDLYRLDTDVAAAVKEWAVSHGHDPLLRIALCGYEGHHEMPPDWNIYAWKAKGGYGNTARNADSAATGKANRHREALFYSPHCIGAKQKELFV